MEDAAPMDSPRRTLIAVHAHPDDESSSTGGVLARYSAEGVRTVVVTCTRGEVGEISDPALAQPENLADVREKELAEAIRILGVNRAVSLGYRDSGMAGTADNDHPSSFNQADLDEAVGRLVRIVREEKPQVLVTYDENGGYGHPDHVRAHQITVAAFAAANDPNQFPEAGGPWQPAKLYYHVWPHSQGLRFMEAFREAGIEPPFEVPEELPPEELLPMGTPDDLVTTAIDVDTYWETKWAALSAHRTQVGPESVFFQLPLERMREIWSTEYFRRASDPGANGGPFAETDLFDGL